MVRIKAQLAGKGDSLGKSRNALRLTARWLAE